MHFAIITPSYNQLEYLKRCIASVADQTEAISHQLLANSHQPNADSSLSIHHHVQDGDSTDGSREFLAEHQAISSEQAAVSHHQSANLQPQTGVNDSSFLYPSLDETAELDVGATECSDTEAKGSKPTANSYTFSHESTTDDGMYDAINKGVDFAMRNQVDDWRLLNDEDGQKEQGEKDPNNHQPTPSNPRDSVIAWLNCDEQYLPGTLEKVSAFFEANPDVDILFGGMLVVDPQGKLLSCRKAMPMRRLFLEASYLYNYSCAMFVRVSFWKKLGGFDTDFKNAGDEELIRRAMKLKAKCGMLKSYLSVFTYSDTNLSSDPAAVQEHEALKRSSSMVSRIFKLPINLMRLIEKGLRGGHVQKTPIEYEIYVKGSKSRYKFKCQKPSCRWPDENKPYLLSHRLK